MENGYFLLKLGIFHCYVRLPEGYWITPFLTFCFFSRFSIWKSHSKNYHGWWGQLGSLTVPTAGVRLKLKDSESAFVFGGDLFDRGPGDLRLARELIDLKKKLGEIRWYDEIELFFFQIQNWNQFNEYFTLVMHPKTHWSEGKSELWEFVPRLYKKQS